MNFSYSSRRLAEALSVVAEAGIHGMKYNGLIESWVNEPNNRTSTRLRWTLRGSPSFSGDEFEQYMILAWRFGLLNRPSYSEPQWTSGVVKSSYTINGEIISLTKEGWEFIEKHDRPYLHRIASKIADDWPTIVMSIIAAFGSSWLLFSWGPQQ